MGENENKQEHVEEKNENVTSNSKVRFNVGSFITFLLSLISISFSAGLYFAKIQGIDEGQNKLSNTVNGKGGLGERVLMLELNDKQVANDIADYKEFKENANYKVILEKINTIYILSQSKK